MSKRELELEIERLNLQEEKIDTQLRQYFSSLSSGQSLRQKSTSVESSDLRIHCQKIDKFAPCFEAMCEDARKLYAQVDDCRKLSDRISAIVRKLDLQQIRAQQALACTEDIINLKECKIKMLNAIEEGNLPLAVGYVRQVHDIDAVAATACDDFEALQQAEANLREIVRNEFNNAITKNDTNRVMSLCPLLQTLGLESTARDAFLDFVEQTMFKEVSADAPVQGTTDPATAYAQALSNIFNTSYSIIQQYLPMIIQGMESSLADVHFIQRMHHKCEREAAVVFKRYMKYRNLKEIISSLKVPTAKHPSVAEMHVILDEVALLLQYCCLYSKYMHQLCSGAEARIRSGSTSASRSSSHASSVATPVVVFPNSGTQFDRMVEEVTSQYYMEGEQWLMQQGMKVTVPRTNDGLLSMKEDVGLDECFFVLRRCGQRAIATNNILVACAVLNVVANLLTSQLLGQLNELLTIAVAKIVAAVQENLVRFVKPVASIGPASAISNAEGFSLGIKSAMSMATSLTASKASLSASKSTSQLNEETEKTVDEDEEDPYHLGRVLRYFNIVEVCVRYTDRLAREVQQTGSVVFAPVASAIKSTSATDFEKIRMSVEAVEGSKLLFQQALRKAAERLSSQLQPAMKEILLHSMGRNYPLGGVRLDCPDDKFDAQPALSSLPRALVAPFETMIAVCTTTLSENNKDLVVGLLADACCERLEHFVSQNSFRFAGALKFEECVRALTVVFTKASSLPIRGKFSRMREILLVLTADVASSPSLPVDNFTSLTPNEISLFLSLRVDSVE